MCSYARQQCDKLAACELCCTNGLVWQDKMTMNTILFIMLENVTGVPCNLYTTCQDHSSQNMCKRIMCFLFRMDQDGSLAISFDEWRDFLLYAPSTDIIEIIKYWRHSTVSA